MKLPNEIVKQGWHKEADDMQFAEAIVRDCATVCAESDGFDMHPKDYYKLILARYGLEPK